MFEIIVGLVGPISWWVKYKLPYTSNLFTPSKCRMYARNIIAYAIQVAQTQQSQTKNLWSGKIFGICPHHSSLLLHCIGSLVAKRGQWMSGMLHQWQLKSGKHKPMIKIRWWCNILQWWHMVVTYGGATANVQAAWLSVTNMMSAEWKQQKWHCAAVPLSS